MLCCCGCEGGNSSFPEEKTERKEQNMPYAAEIHAMSAISDVAVADFSFAFCRRSSHVNSLGHILFLVSGPQTPVSYLKLCM